MVKSARGIPDVPLPLTISECEMATPSTTPLPTSTPLLDVIFPPYTELPSDIKATFYNELLLTVPLLPKYIELVKIGVPASIDWEDLMWYEGFTFTNTITTTTGITNERTLIVHFPRTNGWLADNFTQAIMSLLELAEEVLKCDKLLVCLEKGVQEENSLIKSLLYVGFEMLDDSDSDSDFNKTIYKSNHIDFSSSPYNILQYETEQ